MALANTRYIIYHRLQGMYRAMKIFKIVVHFRVNIYRNDVTTLMHNVWSWYHYGKVNFIHASWPIQHMAAWYPYRADKNFNNNCNICNCKNKIKVRIRVKVNAWIGVRVMNNLHEYLKLRARTSYIGGFYMHVQYGKQPLVKVHLSSFSRPPAVLAMLYSFSLTSTHDEQDEYLMK